MAISFGMLLALTASMKIAFLIFSTLPESGKLALIGVSLITVALLLRKIVVRIHPALHAPAKADAQAK